MKILCSLGRDDLQEFLRYAEERKELLEYARPGWGKMLIVERLFKIGCITFEDVRLIAYFVLQSCYS